VTTLCHRKRPKTGYTAEPVCPRRNMPNFATILKDLPADLRLTPSALKDAWITYAKSSAKPYSFNAFYALARIYAEKRHDEDADNPSKEVEEFVASETFWRLHTNPLSKVLTLGDGATLRIKQGALSVFDQGEERRFEIDGRNPKAIVFAGWGGSVTLGALEFCVANDVALISLGWNGELRVFHTGGPPAEPWVVTAQVRAAQSQKETCRIAREIVRQKISTAASLKCLSPADMRKFSAALDKARNVSSVLNVEATAAVAYWNSRQCVMRGASLRWPQHWARFSKRNSDLDPSAPRRATHPIGAILNYCYSVIDGRISAELYARGANLALGYLHTSRRGRFSLALDTVELLRPLVDDRLFALVAKHKFRRGDFPMTREGEVRIAPTLIRVLLQETYVPQADVAKAADWMIDLIMNGTRQARDTDKRQSVSERIPISVQITHRACQKRSQVPAL
jgi:CRISP-associated protein Cas1